MAITSAKNAVVRIGSAVFYAAKWDVTAKGQKLDITNFESNGYGEYTGGIIDGDVTIEGQYKIGSGPLQAMTPGSIIANVNLYLNGTSGVLWNFPNFYVESFNNSAEVRGVVLYKIVGVSSGTYTGPAS